MNLIERAAVYKHGRRPSLSIFGQLPSHADRFGCFLSGSNCSSSRMPRCCEYASAVLCIRLFAGYVVCSVAQSFQVGQQKCLKSSDSCFLFLSFFFLVFGLGFDQLPMQKKTYSRKKRVWIRIKCCPRLQPARTSKKQL